MSDKLHKLFNSIGTNTLNNEQTSIEIIEEYIKLNNTDKLKVNNKSIYLMLGATNGSSILSRLKGYQKLDEYNQVRKKVVNGVILPIAKFNNLVEVDKKPKTKKEKKDNKEDKQQIVEEDFVANKSDKNISDNAIRNTANNIVYSILFLITQDKKAYSFEKKRVHINIANIEKNVVKSVFGFNKDKVKSSDLWLACNLTLLNKLAKNVLFNVKVLRSIKDTENTEDTEQAISEILESEYSEDKGKTMVGNIVKMLDYLDTNKYFDGIIQVSNHIDTLQEYGQKIFDLQNDVRKQGKNNYDLKGTWACEYNHYKEIKANTFEQLESEYNKLLAIK